MDRCVCLHLASHPSSDVQINKIIKTVVHFVASKGNLDVARKLMDHKPPASARVRDKRGQYPLHRAAAVGSVPMINLLLKNRSPLNATDNVGYTALHHAVAEGHGMRVQHLDFPKISLTIGRAR
jgi:26S proteasome non-ATPase regulatory subunit 10